MISIPDSILNKQGPLSEEEWAKVHQHPIYAYEVIYPIGYLRSSVDIPYCHHEKWDGSGYPRGLSGLLIPESARIFSVVDVFDALTSPRVYRPEPWPTAKARQYLIEQSGKAFDPRVIEIFIKSNPA
jgi:HD-GYP domain-containing protein (c-di-GMP phosphodiesterase class II)